MAWEYQREEHRPSLTPGDYRVVIVETSDQPSKSSGKAMVTLTLRPSGTDIKLKYFVVEGPYANRNFTAIFDSFDIDEGDFDIVGWVGAVGAARLVQDPQKPQYLKIAYFLPREDAVNLPPWRGQKPDRVRIVNGSAFIEADDDEDSPF